MQTAKLLSMLLTIASMMLTPNASFANEDIPVVPNSEDGEALSQEGPWSTILEKRLWKATRDRILLDYPEFKEADVHEVQCNLHSDWATCAIDYEIAYGSRRLRLYLKKSKEGWRIDN